MEERLQTSSSWEETNIPVLELESHKCKYTAAQMLLRAGDV